MSCQLQLAEKNCIWALKHETLNYWGDDADVINTDYWKVYYVLGFYDGYNLYS